MSSEEQADAHLEEAELTLESAEVSYNSAADSGENLWAQVVKNGYDAIEQAVSAGIAAENKAIPRSHPSKINTFIQLYEPDEELEDALLYWLQRRSSSQYVDIRGDEINVPHEQFTRDDAEQILEDIETVLEYVQRTPTVAFERHHPLVRTLSSESDGAVVCNLPTGGPGHGRCTMSRSGSYR